MNSFTISINLFFVTIKSSFIITTSNFFEKDGQFYRLFITIPDEESKVAYLGIENYTGKQLASEKEEVNTDQLDALDELLN